MTRSLFRFVGRIGVVACVLLTVQCNRAGARREPVAMVSSTPAPRQAPVAAPVLASSSGTSVLEQLASSDPTEFLQTCLENYDRTVRDYTCTFIKQEKIGHELTPEQETRVKCRNEPFSVDITWVRNPGDAQRALYVEDRWIDSDGQEQAWVKPAGALIKLILPSVKQPIRGPRAKQASRRFIDQFGFRNTLELIMVFVDKAAREGVLDLQYRGRGQIGGQATFVFERRLPYTGEGEAYPDRLLRYHIDAETLMPVACYSFADDAGTKLLGKYVMTNVVLNPGLTDADFDPQKVGF